MAVVRKTKLKDYIVRKLGGGKMCIELSALHIDDAIDEGFRWFSARRGIYIRKSFSVTEGVQEYDLTTLLTTTEFDQLIDVVNLWLPELSTGYNVFADWNFLDLPSTYPLELNVVDNEFIYSGLVLTLQQREMAKRILSAEIDFEYDILNGLLNIIPEPDKSGTAIFEYKKIVADGDKLSPKDEEILYKAIVAYAKEILGRIRSKYQAIPVPGGSVTLDGEQLLSEARADFELLEQRIQNIEPMGFFSG